MLRLDVSEVVLVAVLVLMFVGPELLPEPMRRLGRAYGELLAWLRGR
jgi:Sec-independent protein translocase protein TatA